MNWQDYICIASLLEMLNQKTAVCFLSDDGFSFCSSITIGYSFFIMVYIHTHRYTVGGAVFQFFLSVSPRGMLSTEKKSLQFKGQSAVLWNISTIFLHLVHLMRPCLSSSWLVTSKHKQSKNNHKQQQETKSSHTFSVTWIPY